MNNGFMLIAGMVIALGACSNMNEKKSNVMNPWTGTYTHHTAVPGADDGTDDYKLEITKAGDQYEVSYSHVSMVSYEYEGKGRDNKSGGLDVIFSSFKSNKGFTKNFKPGNPMFSLKRIKEGARAGVKLDWEMVPGDDLRKSSVTLYREDPAPEE